MTVLLTIVFEITFDVALKRTDDIITNTIPNVTLTSTPKDVGECARYVFPVDADDLLFFLFGDIFYLMNTRFLNQCRCNGIQDFKTTIIKDVFS